jgi:putative spermidine/putrescine transport system ATP-binding protein
MKQKIDLEMVSLTKRYGSTIAVDAISYRFKAGTYACLLGPSGWRAIIFGSKDRGLALW